MAATSIYLADVPTYAALIAAYPERGAALLALPAGTRVYVGDMQCEVRRSASGAYWIPDRVPSGTVFQGSNAHWIGPHGVFTITGSAGHGRKVFRPTYWRMPGFRQATLSRISIYQTAPGTVGSGTDACVLRLYAANPDGSPVVGAAPLFVWDFNAGGTGGASALTLADSGNNAKRIHADLPGGNAEVPPHFWLGFTHDLQGGNPNLSAISASNITIDAWPAALNGTNVQDAVSPPRSAGYEWTQAGAWTIGDAPVWPAGTEFSTAGNAHVVPLLKIV